MAFGAREAYVGVVTFWQRGSREDTLRTREVHVGAYDETQARDRVREQADEQTAGLAMLHGGLWRCEIGRVITYAERLAETQTHGRVAAVVTLARATEQTQVA